MDNKDEALYLRISTDEDEEKQTFETQKHYLMKFTDDEDPRIYRDDVCGADFNRPELNRLLEDCKDGEISKIYVQELTRLGRSLIDLETTFDKLKVWGVDVKALDLGVDTSTPGGRLMRQVLGALAEYEREQIRNRVNRGLERARAEGKQLGRPSKDVPDYVMRQIDKLRNLNNPPSWSEIYDRFEDQIDCSETSIYRKYKKYKQKLGTTKGDQHD